MWTWTIPWGRRRKEGRERRRQIFPAFPLGFPVPYLFHPRRVDAALLCVVAAFVRYCLPLRGAEPAPASAAPG